MEGRIDGKNEFTANIKDLDDPVYLYQNWYRAAADTLV
jgi:hypothetical protein